MDGAPHDGFLFGKLARKMSLEEACDVLPKVILGIVRGSLVFHSISANAGSNRRVMFEIPYRPESRYWIREDDLNLCRKIAGEVENDSCLGRASPFPSEPESSILERLAARVRVEYPQRG